MRLKEQLVVSGFPSSFFLFFFFFFQWRFRCVKSESNFFKYRKKWWISFALFFLLILLFHLMFFFSFLIIFRSTYFFIVSGYVTIPSTLNLRQLELLKIKVKITPLPLSRYSRTVKALDYSSDFFFFQNKEIIKSQKIFSSKQMSTW